ncbi:MAG: DNA polymerase III subunit delta [Betaproteobacteria bacterium]|nr:MAG: DNA polymerase III subunit delta [Betaproteobacteria bacterium]
MQLRGSELEAQLARPLLPAYAIHGDDPLLAMEAADAERTAARRAGYSEREVLEPGRGFDWSEFTHAMGSLSLFATKKVVELRLPTGKPGTQGAAAIAAYCERPSAELLLLVTLPRLDRSGQGSPWFSALARTGVIVDIWPLDRQRLPAWIAERLGRQKQRASRELLEFLAERVEGNLLAAHQEIQKLALLAPPGELSMDTVHAAVASVARYDPYDAAEALLAGDLARYSRVIDGLRAEGEQPTFVLFVVASALFALQEGNAERIFNRTLRRAVEGAMRRIAPKRVEQAIGEAAAIDRAIKGVEVREPWEAFLHLGLNLAGGAKA